MTWAAQQPERGDGHWVARVREHTTSHPCHLTLRHPAEGPREWVEGWHRNAATAYACAEREARQRNRSAA